MAVTESLYRLHRHCLTLGYYPSSLRSFLAFMATLVAWHVAGFDATTFKLARKFQGFLSIRTVKRQPVGDLVTVCLAGTVIWLCLCYLRKLVLRRLLLYRGWMYEGRKMSLRTKAVLATLRALNGWSLPITRQLYGLQGILPSFPVPPLKETVEQYLISVRHLLPTEEYQQTKELAAEFLKGIGPKLEWILKLKSWFYANYISDWWEKYIYLAQRSSILISSNIYFMDSSESATEDQAARAAIIAHSFLNTKMKIKDNTLEPVLIQDLIPLCTWQYERNLDTCRIPGETMDTLAHEYFNEHFVVQHRGAYYKINIFSDQSGEGRRMLNLAELQCQFDRILRNDHRVAVNSDAKLAALTAWDRVNWALTRRKYFSHGLNKYSLDTIEKAAFVVNLDDEDYSIDFEDTRKFEHFARALFHGNGHNRWLDKSVNFVVGTNGRAGGNGEHSWGDAPVGCHLWELCLRAGLDYEGFDEKGRIAGAVKTDFLPFPERLEFTLPEECRRDIETAAASAEGLIENLDLRILPFLDFGRGVMKKCRVSPDAYVQMAMQLAYYRNQGKFDLTYEASMTRLYLQGRTETIRACTEESSSWVLSVVNNSPKEEQIKLFREACNRHQTNYRNSMNGKGIDRHLLGLYVASKYLGKDTAFLENALKMPWRLSTSQTPVSQTKMKPPNCVGGGFGPVSEDGYGVSYIFTGEDMLFFHVTSKRSCPSTDSSRFIQDIREALIDIHAMFDNI